MQQKKNEAAELKKIQDAEGLKKTQEENERLKTEKMKEVQAARAKSNLQDQTAGLNE